MKTNKEIGSQDMNKTIKMPNLIQIKKRNINTEAGTVNLKYINTTNQNREELL